MADGGIARVTSHTLKKGGKGQGNNVLFSNAAFGWWLVFWHCDKHLQVRREQLFFERNPHTFFNLFLTNEFAPSLRVMLLH